MTATKRTRQEQRDYDAGYAAGFRGRALDIDRAKQSPAFEEGHDDGNCDRPTLDELLPIDAGKEASRWWV